MDEMVRGRGCARMQTFAAAMVLAACVATTLASERDPRQRSGPRHSDYQVAAGTYLEIELRTDLSSNATAVGDPVDARLRLPLTSPEGVELVPAGATVLGSVSEVEAAGKNSPGRLVFAFHIIEHPETGSRATIKSAAITFASTRPKKGKTYPDVRVEKGQDASVALLAPLTVRIPHSKR